MASKKSALTAALSGAPTPAAAPVEPIKTFLDPAAFPCIQYADVVDGRGPTPITVEQQLAELDITSIEVVGSAPTNVLLANGTELADYALNPRRRRGGQEAVPEGLAAASSSLEDKMGVSLPRGSVSSNYISQAVIGSLPKGLTNEEKMKRQQSVPQSPSRALLNTLPLDQVASRTLDGRKVRRQVLKGAVMVFVTAGYSGKRFIFEKAKALGVRSIVLDGPDSWVQLLEKDGTVAKFVPIDFTDAETVYDRCYKGIVEAAAQIGEIDGITTFCEIAVPLASRLAEALGLPCNSVEAVDNARDKHATRDIMAKAGLPSPKHYKITSPEDVPKAAEHVGFPAVIKPVSGAASIGVIRVNNVEELDAAYKRVAHDMSKARIVAGALVEGNDDDPVDDTGNAGTWIQLVLMLEEYMDGDEVDCDLVFWDGRPVYGAVTDNWPTVEPYFNETGSNCPSILAKHKQVELLELSVKAVQALGFRLGVFHVECKYTSRGARLIEVNCRMGGGPVRDTNLLVWGVDLVEEHLMACAGIPVKPPVARVPLKQLAEYSINAKITGIMEHVDYCNKWQGAEHVMYCRPLVKAGQKVVCVQDGLPTWVAECMVTCPSVWEAIALVKKIDEEMEAILPIKPLK